MQTKSLKYATSLALTTALISGVSVFLSKIAVTSVKNPIVFTTLKNSLVALLILGIIIALKKWTEIKALTKQQWFKLIAIGIVGGSIPFALFFTGITQTTAINAALIHKTLFLWVLIFAYPFLKERLTKTQWLGIVAIFFANLLIGGFKGFAFNLSEMMILLATILWAIENIIAKKALQDISSLTVAGARMFFGSIVLMGIVAWQGNLSMLTGLNAQQWMWTIIPSILLLGYVMTWYTALKHAPASYVATLIVPATMVTNILSAIFITHAFTITQATSTLLYITGIALLITFSKQTKILRSTTV